MNDETLPPTEEEVLTMVSDHVEDHPLIHNRTILCPKCETRQDILEYTPLHFVQKYALDLVQVLKCRICRHVFAIRP